ncbi:MAG: hypothetical protein QW607_06250 [Desulfurococcaceae archaeon]
MAFTIEELIPKFRRALIFNISSVIADEINTRFLRKQAGKFSDIALIGGGIVVNQLAPSLRLSSDIENVVKELGDAVVAYNTRKAVDIFVFKTPAVWAENSTTIRVVNLDPATLDPTSIRVKVDGSLLTNYTLSGSKEDFKINLSTPLASGTHEIIVEANKKAVYAKIVV